MRLFFIAFGVGALIGIASAMALPADFLETPATASGR